MRWEKAKQRRMERCIEKEKDMTMAGKGLAKLLEELGELAQITAQKLAYANPPRVADSRLEEEMGDVLAAIHLVSEAHGFDIERINARAENKRLLYSRCYKDEQAW